MKEIKQFKFTSGAEVICEVIEWVEEDFREIVVRNCMEIIKVQNPAEIYYVFRPWLHYIESNEDLCVVNSDHIVATANPHPALLMQYDWAVNDAHVASEERMEAYKSERVAKLNEAAIQMKALLSREVSLEDSAEPSNVIPFPIF
jgi:hypothetical protein